MIISNKPKIERKSRVKSPQERIAELKAKLDAEDYKINKCVEYSMNALPLPYDIEALHKQRQQWRDEINELEKQL